MERAKELFLEYHGNRFFMDRDGAGREYDGYRISRETERMWAEEYVRDFLESEAAGREALRAYSTAADLLHGRETEEDWKKCLYYPLRSRHLDDVTVLFMLPCSSGWRRERQTEAASRKKTRTPTCGNWTGLSGRFGNGRTAGRSPGTRRMRGRNSPIPST